MYDYSKLQAAAETMGREFRKAYEADGSYEGTAAGDLTIVLDMAAENMASAPLTMALRWARDAAKK